MARTRSVYNVTRNAVVLPKGHWYANGWDHFRGLMLRPGLPEEEGLIFVYRTPSKTNTTIHMLFVFFSIGVVWLDENLKVVDTKLAKPWRPYYAPESPAQYFIEARPSILERVAIGDQLKFEEQKK
ncbi:MAG: hypothetical protein BroJett018_43770 [Chloroflexota bacterium]|nr:hypothetical protein [Chloroflexota bacterium]GIK66583.1 MAG: hypothetical protein BroJett018_43770 [Chloroflexota bacterium]